MIINTETSRGQWTLSSIKWPWDNQDYFHNSLWKHAVYVVAFPMKLWSEHLFRVGVGTVTLFILSITHVSNLLKHSRVGFFPSLQCHYKTMFFLCGICSNFTALALFCTRCSVHGFLIRVLTMGYGDSFILFYLRMLLLAPAQATVNPRVFFPSDRTTHTSSIIWPLSAWQVTSAFPLGCIMFVCVLYCRDSDCNIKLRQSA